MTIISHVLSATQGPTFGGAFDDKLTEAAYLDKPSWYALATEDGMIPPPVQEAMGPSAKAVNSEVRSDWSI